MHKPKLKLYNVVVQYDIYIVAHDTGDAEQDKREAAEAVLSAIRDGETPTEVVKYEIRSSRDIRSDWRGQKPFVAGTVTDEEWTNFAGTTTSEFFEQISGPTVS